MSHLSLSLPSSIQRHLHQLPAADGVPVEQFVASVVTEKVSALLAADYLRQRAARADPAAMRAVLASGSTARFRHYRADLIRP